MIKSNMLIMLFPFSDSDGDGTRVTCSEFKGAENRNPLVHYTQRGGHRLCVSKLPVVIVLV